MIQPIAIATDGYISTSRLKTLTLATLGWLVIASTTVSGGGGGGHTYEYVHKDELAERHKRLIADDEEVLCIIKTFLKCQS